MTDPTITVCAACLKASCWQGVWMCEEARGADITQKTVAELTDLALEHPDYWADECTHNQARIKVRKPSISVARKEAHALGELDGLRKAAVAMCNQMCGPCMWPTKRSGQWQHLRDSVSTLGLPCWAYVPCKAGPIHDLIAKAERTRP